MRLSMIQLKNVEKIVIKPQWYSIIPTFITVVCTAHKIFKIDLTFDFIVHLG